MTKTRVVNVHVEPYDVYIGRAGKGQDGYFGNPHPVDKICPVCSTHSNVIHAQSMAVKAFKEDFDRRIKTDPEYRTRIHALKGKALGCFCHPKPCHGHVIAEYLESTPSEPKFGPDTDGVDHINVYSQGKTQLGRWLSNWACVPIETEDGHFDSIEGYWYWIGTPDDRLRTLSGYAAKKLGKELRKKLGHDWQAEERYEFKEKISKALRLKARTSELACRALWLNRLPLRHYYVFGGEVKRAGHGWVLDEWLIIRDKLIAAWGEPE